MQHWSPNATLLNQGKIYSIKCYEENKIKLGCLYFVPKSAQFQWTKKQKTVSDDD